MYIPDTTVREEIGAGGRDDVTIVDEPVTAADTLEVVTVLIEAIGVGQRDVVAKVDELAAAVVKLQVEAEIATLAMAVVPPVVTFCRLCD